MPRSTLLQKLALITFGLLLFIVLLESGLRLGGYILSSLQERNNQLSLKRKGAYRILCLGESTTAGGSNSYPAQLEQILNAADTGKTFSVINKGLPATNTTYILAALDENLAEYQPDMVIAMMGINDYGELIPYNDAAAERTPRLVASLKIYKLLRLTWRHLILTVHESGLYKLRNGPMRLRSPSASGSSIVAMSNPANRDGKSDRIRSKDSQECIMKARAYRADGKTIMAEEILRQALELDPANISAYLEFAELYRDRGDFVRAEEFLSRALRIDANNVPVCIRLGRLYRDMGRFDDAVRISRRAIEISPDNSRAYIMLGRAYLSQQKFALAREIFIKAAKLGPGDSDAYAGLGQALASQALREEALNVFQQLASEVPMNEYFYFELNRIYRTLKKFDKVEESLKKAIEVNPRYVNAYLELGQLYKEQGKYEQAKETFERVTAIEQGERSNGGLGSLYQEAGKIDAATAYYEKANQLRLKHYNPITSYNYRNLKKTLDSRGIKLICVQYPVVGIDSLRKLFGDCEGMVFVDNEKVFKDAMQGSGYKELFVDSFGGEFGHCTLKGNRLLAHNIAQTILKEFFDKS